jgi:hypothetical protein
MKHIIISFMTIILLSPFGSRSQDAVKPSGDQVIQPVVEVYYFHFSRRCQTCKSVEANSKQAMETLYPEKMKSGEYLFQEVNLDEEESEAISKRLGIESQSLLIVHGDRKIDITAEGFMNAGSLEKMKSLIEKKVEEILKG